VSGTEPRLRWFHPRAPHRECARTGRHVPGRRARRRPGLPRRERPERLWCWAMLAHGSDIDRIGSGALSGDAPTKEEAKRLVEEAYVRAPGFVYPALAPWSRGGSPPCTGSALRRRCGPAAAAAAPAQGPSSASARRAFRPRRFASVSSAIDRLPAREAHLTNSHKRSYGTDRVRYISA
jgi:hypothetical protein